MDAVFQPLADFQSVIFADAAARARDCSPCVMAYLIGCGAECVRHPRKGAGLDNSRARELNRNRSLAPADSISGRIRNLPSDAWIRALP